MKMNLGNPLLTAAATGIARGMTSGGSRSAPPPGTPGVTGQSPTTINPAFQQSFTPQFSPAMQQQQDSPGASQSANPTQRANVGQRAAPFTGEGVVSPSREPLIPRGIMPVGYDTPAYSPTVQSGGNYNNLIMLGVGGAIAIIITKMLVGKNTKPKPRK